MLLSSELSEITDKLCSGSFNEAALGVAMLDTVLRSLVPAIKNSRTSGAHDARLAEFLACQDSFQLNMASALLSAYTTLLESGNSTSTILVANRLLQGLLLIHLPSRNIFSRKCAMRTVLSFLEPSYPLYLTEVCVSVVSLLVHILLKNTANMRVFEACGGPLLVIRHLQLDGPDPSTTEQTLRFKVVEFLIFYLGDETELGLVHHNRTPTLTTQQKAELFRPDFPGINELIESLNNLTSL